jgi:hypothetical protein
MVRRQRLPLGKHAQHVSESDQREDGPVTTRYAFMSSILPRAASSRLGTGWSGPTEGALARARHSVPLSGDRHRGRLVGELILTGRTSAGRHREAIVKGLRLLT